MWFWGVLEIFFCGENIKIKELSHVDLKNPHNKATGNFLVKYSEENREFVKGVFDRFLGIFWKAAIVCRKNWFLHYSETHGYV
jgi:hypothetical protein